MASRELRCRHKALLHKFLHMAQHNDGISPILLRHGSRRKGLQHLQDPGISLISFVLFFLSLLSIPFSFSGVGKEVRRGQRIMQKDIGVRKGDCQL
jgi:hypothetical protein